MADVLISDLSFSQPLSGDELLPIVQNGTSYKVSVSSVGNAGDTENINGCDNTIVSGSTVSSIVGGCSNTLDGNCSTILGGLINTLSADFGVIGGGADHTINSTGGVIGGGSLNTIEENTYIDTIGGGNSNCVGASFKNSFIGGGLGNTMFSHSPDKFCSSFSSYTNSIISGRENALGGYNFTKTMCSNTIAGGQFNGIGGICLQTYPNEDFTANHNFIGGGKRNAINGHCSGITAGYRNEIFSNLSGAFIGGGVSNTIRNVDGADKSHYSTIAGGKCNTLSSEGGFIGGGMYNYTGNERITQLFGGTLIAPSVIVGGFCNINLGGEATFIGGGVCNKICTNYSSSTDSAILNGYTNVVESSKNGSILGGNINRILNCTCDGEKGKYNIIVGGAGNTLETVNDTQSNSIINGNSNVIKDKAGSQLNYSTIINGFNNIITPVGSTSRGVIGTGSEVSLSGSGVIMYGVNSWTCGENNFMGAVYTGTIEGNTNFIGTGVSNTIDGDNSSIISGVNNTVNHDNSHIAGSNITTVSGDMLHANTLYLSAAALPTTDPGIPGVVWRDGTDLKISV